MLTGSTLQRNTDKAYSFERSLPGKIALTQEQVHVWRVPLACSSGEEAYLETLLTSEEAVRTARYRFEKDRSAFIVRRGVLRILLGRYLEEAPFRLPFSITAFGRPVLAVCSAGVDKVDVHQCFGFNVRPLQAP